MAAAIRKIWEWKNVGETRFKLATPKQNAALVDMLTRGSTGCYMTAARSYSRKYHMVLQSNGSIILGSASTFPSIEVRPADALDYSMEFVPPDTINMTIPDGGPIVYSYHTIKDMTVLQMRINIMGMLQSNLVQISDAHGCRLNGSRKIKHVIFPTAPKANAKSRGKTRTGGKTEAKKKSKAIVKKRPL